MKLHLTGCVVDLGAHEVVRDHERAALTPQEHALLEHLVARVGEAVSREELLGEVWGWKASSSTRAVDNTMMRLRAKLGEQPGDPSHIFTVRGVGYRYEGPAGDAVLEVPEAIGLVGPLTELLAAVDAGRLVTVTGPGGVGKTTLARAALRRRTGVFCDLSAVHAPDDAAAQVAAQLGAGAGNPAAAVEGALRRGAGVVVLDNLEQLLPEMRPLVIRWTEACAAGTALLVTTRVRLHAPGETHLTLAPLPVDDAVALYRQTAGLPDGPPTPAERALVAAVDGLPLAVQLLAGWSDLGTPEQLLAMLDGWLGGLADRSGEGGRHGSVPALLAGSWDRLPPDLARDLCRLAPFRGFDLPAASAVLGRLAVPVVAALRDHSLVHAERTPEGEVRFRLLELVRIDAEARLAADPVAQASAEEAHADWVAARVRALAPLKTTDRRGHKRLLERERGNLLAVVGRADRLDADRVGRAVFGLCALALEGGDPALALERVDRVYSRVTDPAVRLDLTVARAMWLFRLSLADQAEPMLAASAEGAWAISATKAATLAAVRSVHLLSWRGTPERTLAAQAVMRDARDRAVASGDPEAAAIAWGYLGKALLHGGDTEAAREALEEGVALYGRVGNRDEQVRVQTDLAQLYLRQGRVHAAIAVLDQALVACRELEHWYALQLAGLVRGYAGLDDEDPAGAEGPLREVLAVPEGFRSAYLQAEAALALGDAALALGRRDEAVEHWRRAGAGFLAARQPVSVALAHGRLRTLRGEPVADDVPEAARPLVEALRSGSLVDASEFPARQAARLAEVLERHRR